VSEAVRAAVLTVSDRVASGDATDESGPAVANALQERLGARIVSTACVADEIERIEATLRAWLDGEAALDVVVTTGGTGLAPRDVTPEAAMRVIERLAPGLMELARARTGVELPLAYLSRGVAGAAGRTLILTLPGSPRGAVEQLEALADVLPHAIETLRGEGSHGGSSDGDH